MFELKLKTGTVLKVDTVEERYTNRSEVAQKVLNIRINSGAVSLEAVLDALEIEGALSEIVVTDETGLKTTFTAYQTIESINRILVPGGANVSISLSAKTESVE